MSLTLRALVLGGGIVALLNAAVGGSTAAHAFFYPRPKVPAVLEVRPGEGEDAPAKTMVIEGFTQATTAAVDLEQTVSLPGGFAAVKLVQFLPSAEIHQTMTPVKLEGLAGVELVFEGSGDTRHRWLAAGDPTRDLLTSFIGTWRYVVAKDRAQRDAFHREFSGESTRAPSLVASRPDGANATSWTFGASETRTFADLGCTLRIVSFFEDFSMNRETRVPYSRSKKMLNPAVLVEIEHKKQKAQRWVFARFPDFQLHKSEDIPVKIQLDCPTDDMSSTPGFIVMSTAGTDHEIWIRTGGEVKVMPAKLNEKIDVPGSKYTFHVAGFMSSGSLAETYKPTTERDGGPVLRVEVPKAGATGSETVWLEAGKPRTIQSDGKPVVLEFRFEGPSRAGHGGGTPTLRP